MRMTFINPPFQSWKRVFFIFCVIAISAFRLFCCFRVPLCTTDLLRNMGYGLEFWDYGPQVYDLYPEDFSPASYSTLWPVHYYTYPAITLLFFALIVKIWPSIVFGKLILTLLAAINCFYIRRLTRNPWLALLYWINPLSIWFVSYEGQFEEMAVFWVLLAISALRKNQPIAYLYLAIGIQTKLFPVFLIPYFLQCTYQSDENYQGAGFAWFVVGFLPSLYFVLTSQYLAPLLYPGFVPGYNAVSWALQEFKFFPLQPFGIMFLHNIVGGVFIAVAFYFMWKTKEFVPYFAALFFVCFVKNNKIAQPWYLLLTPAFCLTVENEKHRRILFILSLGFGLDCFIRMFYPGFKHNNIQEVLILLKKNMYWIH